LCRSKNSRSYVFAEKKAIFIKAKVTGIFDGGLARGFGWIFDGNLGWLF
jgi:hypothetical protein